MTDEGKFGGVGLDGVSLGDSKCSECKHLRAGGQTCDAFPDGIPMMILSGEVLHAEPYPGAHGIRFERTVVTKG